VLEADPHPQIYTQAFINSHGDRKVLLINKRTTAFTVRVTGGSGGSVQVVDQTTEAPAVQRALSADTVELSPLAVAVVTLPH